jgi:hypothetical protein
LSSDCNLNWFAAEVNSETCNHLPSQLRLAPGNNDRKATQRAAGPAFWFSRPLVILLRKNLLKSGLIVPKTDPVGIAGRLKFPLYSAPESVCSKKNDFLRTGFPRGTY